MAQYINQVITLGNWSCVQGYIGLVYSNDLKFESYFFRQKNLVMKRLVLFHFIQTFLPSGKILRLTLRLTVLLFEECLFQFRGWHFGLLSIYFSVSIIYNSNSLTFRLDPRASPARISLTITSLLTLTTMSNGARQVQFFKINIFMANGDFPNLSKYFRIFLKCRTSKQWIYGRVFRK